MLDVVFRQWRWAALVVAAGALWAHGNYVGGLACENKHQEETIEIQKELFAAAEEASRKEALRLEAESEREEMAQQLEDAAYAEAPTNCGLPVSRVLRLKER